MLRFALLVLLLANVGYLSWSQGWMATLGWAPKEQAEPYRLQQQVRPDVLSIVQAPAAAVAAPSNAAPQAARAEPVEEILPEVTVCLQSDNMNEEQYRNLQSVLRSSELPAESWEFVSKPMAGRWMVYLGKFPNETAVEKRRAELRSHNIANDRAGELGLSLGRFASEEAATRELGTMLKRGVRGARVVQERAPHVLYALRLEESTAAQRTLLNALEPALDGKRMMPCA